MALFNNWNTTAEKVWKIIGIGFIVTPVLYILAFIIEFLACFCPCSGSRCGDWEQKSGCVLGTVWSGASFGYTFLFLAGAGIVIGIIYGIAVGTQERRDALKNANEMAKKNWEQSIFNASSTVKDVKNKSDNIVSQINGAERTIVSAKAIKILEEAALLANASALALKGEDKISKKAIGKSSKRASKNAQNAQGASRFIEKDVDRAYDLYYQATKEEAAWKRLQQEANDTAQNANNAKDNAEKEIAKIEKMVFISVAAKDAASKATYALEKAKEAASETVKRVDAAARAPSAQDAQTEVFQAKYSEKRALVEEKIVVEEAKIAIEAEETVK